MMKKDVFRLIIFIISAAVLTKVYSTLLNQQKHFYQMPLTRIIRR